MKTKHQKANAEMETNNPFSPPAFRFGMRQVVKTKDGTGTVIGRAEHAVGKPTYLVRDIESRSLTQGKAHSELELVAF